MTARPQRIQALIAKHQGKPYPFLAWRPVSPFGTPNRVNRRAAQINGSKRYEVAWLLPGGAVSVYVIDGQRAMLETETNDLPDVSTAPTTRAAYEDAGRQSRLARRRRHIVRLLRQRRRVITRLRRARQTIATLRQVIQNQNDGIQAMIAQQLDDAATIERLEAEISALRAQVISQAKEDTTQNDQIAELTRKLNAAHAENIRQLAKYRKLQGEHTGLLAHHATLRGRCDDLCRQLGLPTSDDLAVPPRKSASKTKKVTS